jgi:hypothetical protein
MLASASTAWPFNRRSSFTKSDSWYLSWYTLSITSFEIDWNISHDVEISDNLWGHVGEDLRSFFVVKWSVARGDAFQLVVEIYHHFTQGHPVFEHRSLSAETKGFSEDGKKNQF